MKIRPMKAMRTDTTKLIVAFLNFANAPKEEAKGSVVTDQFSFLTQIQKIWSGVNVGAALPLGTARPNQRSFYSDRQPFASTKEGKHKD